MSCDKCAELERRWAELVKLLADDRPAYAPEYPLAYPSIRGLQAHPNGEKIQEILDREALK